MRFHAEHQFAAPPRAVARLLVDPAFHRDLRLPDVALLEVSASDTEDGRHRLHLRYEFVGHLDPFARRLLGGRELTWLQELRLDPASGEGRLSFHAERDPQRLRGSAEFAIEPRDGGAVRRLDGELVVAVPLIGSRAERHIVPGLLRRLDIEAWALDQRLGAERPGPGPEAEPGTETETD